MADSLPSNRRPKLLDLFCCEGGAGTGYAEAGFEVVGIDLEPQPRYPFEFVRTDALEYLHSFARMIPRHFDAIHASPPCQAHCDLQKQSKREYRDVIPEVRVIRHRLFETNWPLKQPAHQKSKHPLVFTHDKRKAHYGRLDQNTSYVQVTGGGNCTIANKRAAMGTPWMSGHGCNEAIPPAYTRWIGSRLLEHINADRLELAA